MIETTTTEGAGAFIATMAGRHGEGFPADKVAENADTLVAWKQGLEDHYRAKAATYQPDEQPADPPAPQGPGLLSSAIAMVTGRRLSASDADLAQIVDPLRRAGFRISRGRPGGLTGFVCLAIAAVLLFGPMVLGHPVLTELHKDPIVRIGALTIIAIVAVGAAFCMAQWVMIRRDAVDLAREGDDG